MGWIASVVVALATLAQAIMRIREDQRRGIPIEWAKTLWTMAGVMAATVAGFAVMFWCIVYDRPLEGLGAFVLVFGGGLMAVIIAVNRRWPRRTGV